jgi:hypothetical protein
VTGQARRGGRALALNVAVGGAHRRRFALNLIHVRGVRFVTLRGYGPGRGVGRRLVVRVR